MRKVTGLALLVGAVIAPLSLAQAATEVTRFSANNVFANVVATDPATGTTTGVFVTRQKGEKGGPVDTIFFIVSRPDGSATFGSGTLPKNAFHSDAKSASLDVDIADIDITADSGDLPASGIISVDWAVTDTTRASGSTKQDFGNVHVNFVGTGATSIADATGSVLGAPLVEPAGSVTILHQGTIIVTKD